MQRIDSLNLVKCGHVIGRRTITPPIGSPFIVESSVVRIGHSLLVHTDQGWN
jgi:hypothetical protein